MSEKTELKNVTGIEVQKEVAQLANRNVELNKLEKKIKIINCDIKEIISKKILEKNKYDVIITNPPYKEKGTGKINENSEKIISRHETTATLFDFIKISAELLKSEGEFYMVHKPERIVDIIETMRKNKIEPKELKIVYPRKGEGASLILIKGIKAGKKFMKIDKPLYIYEENGEYTKEIKEIYNN